MVFSKTLLIYTRKLYWLFGIILFLGSLNHCVAQGCSDAGFCTLGPLKPDIIKPADEKSTFHRITFISPTGQGDENVFVWTPALQYDLAFKGGWNIQSKITGNYANGNLGNQWGAGDIFLSANRSKALKNKWILSWTAGVKIPLNQANLSFGGKPLPMQYQSSLGTFDVLGGITYSSIKWQFSAGFQQPLTGANKNGFLPEFWNGKPEANNYPPTFRLNRKGDVLLRGSRNFGFSKGLFFNAGLLGIYHLGEDTYMNPFENNRVERIEGSSGLTLNVTGAAYWQIKKNIRIGILGGAPLVVRDVRPDGLTRSWVISPEVSWLF